jgi:hypothetical protein
MAAKNRHNMIDCLGSALPDEEYFVLLARDPLMPALLGIWASFRVGNLAAAAENFRLMGTAGLLEHYRQHPDQAKSLEAVACAQRAAQWREDNLNGPNGQPTWKQSLVRPKLIDVHLGGVCDEAVTGDLIDQLIDAVAGNCDTDSLDRDAARRDIEAIMGRGNNVRDQSTAS